jgi:hypothetical protein
VTTVCSEYSLRAAGGDSAIAEAHPAIVQLSVRLLEGLRESDRALLVWLGERVPSTVIADWCGSTPNAIKVKISRLRARLRIVAGEYLRELKGEAREEVERFFQRAGVVVPSPVVVKTVIHEQKDAPAYQRASVQDAIAGRDYPSPYDPEER